MMRNGNIGLAIVQVCLGFDQCFRNCYDLSMGDRMSFSGIFQTWLRSVADWLKRVRTMGKLLKGLYYSGCHSQANHLASSPSDETQQ